MPQKIRWGILGPGKIARKFAQDLQFSNHGYLYALASRSASRIESFQKDFSVARQYLDYEELLQDPDVDVVYIATPHSHHYPWILRCLEYGKAVLCEKPMCINAAQVREVIRKQQETGLFVMEALWTRFLPAYIHLRKELDNQILDITSITADFCYYSPRGAVPRVYEPHLAGGSLLDIGIYPLFLALDLMGPPVGLQATGWVDQGVDVRMTTTLQYDQGRSAMLYSDVQSATRMDAIIRLPEKVYVIPHQWHKMDEYLVVEDQRTTRHEVAKIGWGYFHEIEHVHQCLSQGLSQSPLFPLSQSLQLAHYMDAIRHELSLIYPEAIEKI